MRVGGGGGVGGGLCAGRGGFGGRGFGAPFLGVRGMGASIVPVVGLFADALFVFGLMFCVSMSLSERWRGVRFWRVLFPGDVLVVLVPWVTGCGMLLVPVGLLVEVSVVDADATSSHVRMSVGFFFVWMWVGAMVGDSVGGRAMLSRGVGSSRSGSSSGWIFLFHW